MLYVTKLCVQNTLSNQLHQLKSTEKDRQCTDRQTWSKSGGMEDASTKLLTAAGAPLRKSNAEVPGASEDDTTMPDLKVCELNSSTRLTERVATLEAEAASGRLGSTTVSLD